MIRVGADFHKVPHHHQLSLCAGIFAGRPQHPCFFVPSKFPIRIKQSILSKGFYVGKYFYAMDDRLHLFIKHFESFHMIHPVLGRN